MFKLNNYFWQFKLLNLFKSAKTEIKQLLKVFKNSSYSIQQI